jgi:sulfoxide reductase catalytic subunit YedY
MADLFKSVPLDPSEVTPKELYLSRRDFLKTMGILGAGTLLAACVSPQVQAVPPTPTGLTSSGTTDELGNPLNTYDQITNYNNFYEFTTSKPDVAGLSQGFKTSPWQVQVYGLVAKPRTFALDELIHLFPPEERIYRLRCVEAWSMVIPWQGFALSKLLDLVQPTSEAKYVRFESLLDPAQMPGQNSALYPWPYQEGLRLDEAQNELTILATGLYGEPLPPQDGAPIRLVVPWKYGFKSIKSIIKIELTADQPATMWSTISPGEYGFYSNVNPQVDHPRWSQASERRIGEVSRRETLMFNGYSAQVAHLYEGLDLSVNF